MKRRSQIGRRLGRFRRFGRRRRRDQVVVDQVLLQVREVDLRRTAESGRFDGLPFDRRGQRMSDDVALGAAYEDLHDAQRYVQDVEEQIPLHRNWQPNSVQIGVQQHFVDDGVEVLCIDGIFGQRRDAVALDELDLDVVIGNCHAIQWLQTFQTAVDAQCDNR